MTMIIVPPLPRDSTGWRKTVAGLTAGRGGQQIRGEWLQPGDTVDAPPGTLVLGVDQTLVGYRERNGGPEPVHEVDVTIYLVDDAGFTRQWGRHFSTSQLALGATTRKRLFTLLAEYPAPAGELRVVVAVRRPNRRDGDCCRCGGLVPARSGHVVGHAAAAVVEHWRSCPTRRDDRLVTSGQS